MTLAHPKGGWANADAFIFNINLEQTQEQLQFFSMTLIRGKKDRPEHLEAVLYVCFAIASPALTLLDIYSTASLPLPSLPLENELIAQDCSFSLKDFAHGVAQYSCCLYGSPGKGLCSLIDIYHRFVPLQVHHRSSVDLSPNGVCLTLTIASYIICSCLSSVTCPFDQMYKQRDYCWRLEGLRKIRCYYTICRCFL